MTAQGCAAVASLMRGVSVEDIMGHTRKRHIVQARWDAWALMRAGGETLERTAEEFGRDESTIRNGLRRREELT